MICSVQFPVAAIVCATFVPTSSSAEPITVSDTKGRTMEIRVHSYTESSGNLRLERVDDGRFFNVKIDLFDAESQEKIKEVAPRPVAELDAKLSVGRRRERLGDSSYMKRQTISSSMRIAHFMNGAVTVFIIGRQTSRYADREADYGKVLLKQNFRASVRAGEEFEYECKAVVTEYDSDRDSTNIGGWEYYGYAFIIQNEDGSVHTAETSIGNLQTEMNEDPEHVKTVLALSAGATVEKNLERR